MLPISVKNKICGHGVLSNNRERGNTTVHKKTTSQNRNPSFLFEICGYDDDITTIDLIGEV